jgi:hypothetical protein
MSEVILEERVGELEDLMAARNERVQRQRGA